ncbi:G-protein coupled receptor GRL101-like [Tubulanus polymorphus]|uniref:G-protein coupled receptor GRL101-like n=1 Tax=Tubulanus polymorphus TaxID=672921 RepID=UPI003DA3301E
MRDCVDGSDENSCYHPPCLSTRYRCSNHQCIDSYKRCDGLANCKDGSDEIGCTAELCQGFSCGDGECISSQLYRDGVVDCSGSLEEDELVTNMTLNPDVYCNNGNHCTTRFTDLCKESDEQRYLTHNRLTSLSANTFAGLIGLKQLFLIGNPLQHLEDGSFRDLVNNFEVISVQRNVLGDLTSLKYLASDAYKFCCMASNVDRCLPEADQFSTCSDLMGNAVLRAIIWMIATFSFLANSIVIAFRVQALRMESTGTRNTSSDIFIINIAGCDFLMSVYLFLIAGADHVFKGVYYLNSETWTDSSLCRLAGVIVAVSCEGSLTFLLILTRQRYSNIVNPFSRSPIITPKYVIGICSICWLVISTVSILPLSSSSYFGDNFYGTTGVCLPMNLLTIDVNGWHYSFAIFALFNAAVLATIMTTYAQMYRLVSGSRSGSGRADPTELVLARRSLVINLCNLFCWLPIIIVQFCAVFSVEIPNQVAAWLAVLFLPINSSLNPLLYTILTIDMKSIRERNKRRLGLTTSSK